jgi:hypothetical protein
MSPEQVSGDPVDHRSDLFSLGAVLYEAATGRPAFQGGTRTEIAAAILAPGPPVLDQSRLSSGVAQVITRCLAKSPAGRYQNAADLAFTLHMLAPDASRSLSRRPSRAPRGLPWRYAAAMAIAAAATAFITLVLPDPPFSSPISMQPLTYRHGRIGLARFAPDGETIVYGASWDGEPFRLFTTRAGAVGSRPIDLPPADLLALSPRDDLAIVIGRPGLDGFQPDGRLAVVPRSGGSPRPRYERAIGADFGPGTLMVAERGQPARPLRADLGRAGNCVWSANGQEIWTSASGVSAAGESGGTTNTSLVAVDLAGRQRSVNTFSQYVRVLDVAPDGRMLVATSSLRHTVHGAQRPGEREVDLSTFDATFIGHLRSDGGALTLWDDSTAGGDSVFLRMMGGSPPVRLGEGLPFAMTPDGSSVAVLLDPSDDSATFHKTIVLLSTGADSPRRLSVPIEVKQAVANPLGREDLTARDADFSADGGRLLIPAGREPGRPPRVYVHDLHQGWTKAVTPEHVTGPAVLSPDGRRVAVKEGATLMVYTVDDAGGQPLPGPVEPGMPARWSADGRFIFVLEDEGAAVRVVRRDVSTGRREFLHEVRLPDPAGVMRFDVRVAADGQAYAYATSQSAGTLFLLEGLH